jgi:hypothetical protein
METNTGRERYRNRIDVGLAMGLTPEQARGHYRNDTEKYYCNARKQGKITEDELKTALAVYRNNPPVAFNGDNQDQQGDNSVDIQPQVIVEEMREADEAPVEKSDDDAQED